MPAVSPEILARLEGAYQGEVFGLAMYAAIADAQADPVRRWKWQVLTQLEAETKAQIAALLERLGGDTCEQEQSRRNGLKEARAINCLPWLDMIEAFKADLPSLVEDYANLDRQATLSGDDARLLIRLTHNEVVTLEFCERELAGDSESSTDPVLAMLDDRPAFPVTPSGPTGN